MNNLDIKIRKILRENINKLLSEASQNISFNNFKSQMSELGFNYEKGKASNHKFVHKDYPNVIVQTHCHGGSLAVDPQALEDTLKRLSQTDWFDNEDNYNKFPFDAWEVSRKKVRRKTEGDGIIKANQLYNDAELQIVFPEIKDSILAMKVNQKVNLCRNTQDRRPLLNQWFNGFTYDNQGRPCLVLDDYEKFVTKVYPINPDGSLNVKEMHTESRKRNKNFIY